MVNVADMWRERNVWYQGRSCQQVKTEYETCSNMEELTNKEAMARVGDAKLVYCETYSIGADKKGNLVDKRYYKKKV